MQFDSQISIASACVQKLQADTINNLIRCPYLATIEIERRKHLRGKGNDDNLMDGVVQYFCRYLMAQNLSFLCFLIFLLKNHAFQVLCEMAGMTFHIG